MKDFIRMILGSKLTQNEISILLEAGYMPFTRADLLRNPKRVEEGIYNAPPLTRTIAKLRNKELLKEETYAGTRRYSYIGGNFISYGAYEKVILAMARSRIMTLNTLRVALHILENDNKLCSARYISSNLGVDPDYLVNTVLPRMYLVGLLAVEDLNLLGGNPICEEDMVIISRGERLKGFKINLSWDGKVNERWL